MIVHIVCTYCDRVRRMLDGGNCPACGSSKFRTATADESARARSGFWKYTKDVNTTAQRRNRARPTLRLRCEAIASFERGRAEDRENAERVALRRKLGVW